MPSETKKPPSNRASERNVEGFHDHERRLGIRGRTEEICGARGTLNASCAPHVFALGRARFAIANSTGNYQLLLKRVDRGRSTLVRTGFQPQASAF